MPQTPTTTLHIVTMPQDSDQCDGTYTCECQGCRTEVAQRVERGVLLRGAPLPLKRAA